MCTAAVYIRDVLDHDLSIHPGRGRAADIMIIIITTIRVRINHYDDVCRIIRYIVSRANAPETVHAVELHF